MKKQHKQREKKMFQDVNFSMFIDSFQRAGRKDQFTYLGLKAIYDYLTDLEYEIGSDIELDVIAICCEYCEYGSIEELKGDYSNIRNIRDLREHTTVIEIMNSQGNPTGGLIIQNF